ncbi:hypothetical protein [Nocardioides sp. NPDC127503]|uniref:hypothetical protein n=1 Tax=Nocardioides sp. NPDC127503 TaxID=3154516 RepID=UPI003331EEDC
MRYSTRVERTHANRLIELGATWTESLPRLQFRAVVVCDVVSPDRWHAEIRFGGRKLISTPQVDTHERASRQAGDAFEAKIVELFSGD